MQTPQEESEKKCPGCGSTHVEVISTEQFKEGHEAGIFYELDPKLRRCVQKKAWLKTVWTEPLSAATLQPPCPHNSPTDQLIL
jgi:hypothetical protein